MRLKLFRIPAVVKGGIPFGLAGFCFYAWESNKDGNATAAGREFR